MTAQQIRQRLDTILAHMQPHWEFVNCHMVNFLTDNHWLGFVPSELRSELDSATRIEQCIEQVFWCKNKTLAKANFPEFMQFLNKARDLSLDAFTDVLTTVDDLLEEETHAALTIKEFMSEKKRHEVEITAELVNKLIAKNIAASQDMYIIDAGDGKGYLSSRLALQYGHKVLGIDANESNTENALERNRKLQRAWNGLTERATLQSQGIIPPRRGKKPINNTTNADSETIKPENYKTTAKYINTDLNLTALLEEYFHSTKDAKVCLTGLHTCGNLAATCLQVFHAQESCKILCNIGCCYHLLKEAYSGQEFFGNKALMSLQTTIGFPLSKYLQAKHISLGRNARMLAAQSVERNAEAQELPNISLYYRALLEVLICSRDASLKDTLKVGKIRKFNNFNEYVSLCAKKLQTSSSLLHEISEHEIAQTLEAHKLDKYYLDLFYLLRMSFAPVLEALILLDRLLYLKELGYERSYLISLFDAVISPRHFAIVALKD